MILASRSDDSSSSNRMPLTVPPVPTGINTGVSITPRRVVNTPARASPTVASISNLIGAIKTISPAAAQRRNELVSPLRLCAAAGVLLMLFDDPYRRREEIKLLAQTIQEI